MWPRILALVIGIAALATLLASGPGVRLGLWDWRFGLGLLRYAAYIGIAASVFSLVVFFWKGRSLAVAIAFLLGVAAFAPPILFQRQARSAPPINDVSASIDLKGTDSFARALSAAQALGWEIVAQDAATGRIEAVDTTFWFGFKDDVAIQVRGDRVDIRSRSRVGRGDTGTNAQRIRRFRAELLK